MLGFAAAAEALEDSISFLRRDTDAVIDDAPPEPLHCHSL